MFDLLVAFAIAFAFLITVLVTLAVFSPNPPAPAPARPVRVGRFVTASRRTDGAPVEWGLYADPYGERFDAVSIVVTEAELASPSFTRWVVEVVLPRRATAGCPVVIEVVSGPAGPAPKK